MTAAATTLTAILGVIVGIGPAVEALDNGGLPVIASRDWVRSQITPMRTQMTQYNSIKLDIANGKKEAAERDLDKLELDAIKPGISDEEKVRNLQAQRRVKETIEATKNQIRAIELGHR